MLAWKNDLKLCFFKLSNNFKKFLVAIAEKKAEIPPYF